MFSTPETSVHVWDENREISPLERERKVTGERIWRKRWVLRREWKTLWDTPTTDLGAESEPGNGGEHSGVANWQGTRRDGGSLFHRWGAAYRKERLVIIDVQYWWFSLYNSVLCLSYILLRMCMPMCAAFIGE